MPENREISFQLHLAEERLSEAKLLYEWGYFNGTVSRAYYSMFAATKAALLLKKLK